MKRFYFLGILAAGLAVAQGPGGPGFAWWDSPIAKDLNLTEDQHKKIQSVVAGSRSKVILLRANLDAAEAELGELMNSEQIDGRKANAAIEKVLNARTELGRHMSQMSLALRQVLTLKQWQELERRSPHHAGGPPEGRGPGLGQGRPGPDRRGPQGRGPQGPPPPPPPPQEE